MPRSKKPKKPATSFKPAPVAEAMAQPIIDAWHKHLRDCECRIEFIFRSDTQKGKGKLVMATAQKVTSLAAFFGRDLSQEFVKPFFAIVISEPQWCHCSEAQRKALLDHELCHCGARKDNDGNTVLEILPHDLEEFTSIVDRHGYWKSDVRQMAESMAAAPQIAMDLSGMSDEVSAVANPATRAALREFEKAVAELGPSSGVELVEISVGDRAVNISSDASKWVDCPQCKGLAKRRGKRATCGCGWQAEFDGGVWQPTI